MFGEGFEHHLLNEESEAEQKEEEKKRFLDRLEFYIAEAPKENDYNHLKEGDQISSRDINPRFATYEEIKDDLPEDFFDKLRFVLAKNKKDENGDLKYMVGGRWELDGEKIYINGMSHYVPENFLQGGIWILGVFDKDFANKKDFIRIFNDDLEARQNKEKKENKVYGFPRNADSIAFHPEKLKYKVSEKLLEKRTDISAEDEREPDERELR